MSDLICDVITCCVGSWVMGKINIHDKIVTENQKREKLWTEKKDVYINLRLKDGLGIELTAC